MVDKLMRLLGIAGSKNKAMAQFAIDDAAEVVKNHCHIKEIPEGLENTVIRMALDIYRYENLGNEGAADMVSSVKAGDTETRYQLMPDTYSQSLLKNYKAQLNRFRKTGR